MLQVQTRRLRVLVELARLGSMHAVAEALGTTTSNVSQQVAALARDVGVALVEPAGRRVRLTPAGRRLAEHAVSILAAVDAARLDLDPAAAPAGTLRIAGFATAIRRSLLPVMAELAASHPEVRVLLHEHEPAEAALLLAADEVDLALTYDYTLAPARADRTLDATPLWSTEWGLGVPVGCGAEPANAVQVFRRFREVDWIVNSRNSADEQVVRTVASMAGFEPRIAHQVDSLELVQDLVVAGLGVGLLPVDGATLPAVRLLPLDAPAVTLRAFAVTRHGRGGWPPLELVLARLRALPVPAVAAVRTPRAGPTLGR